MRSWWWCQLIGLKVQINYFIIRLTNGTYKLVQILFRLSTDLCCPYFVPWLILFIGVHQSNVICWSHTHAITMVSASKPLQSKYISVYNLIQTLGWSYTLIKTLRNYNLLKTNRLWKETQTPLKIFQTLGLIEVELNKLIF